jgi:hypothetical protein
MGLNMNAARSPQGTMNTPPGTSRAYVVHDAGGKILHIHHSVEFDGGVSLTEGAASRARRLAGSPKDAAVIETDPAEVSRRHPIRVDTATGKIVPA